VLAEQPLPVLTRFAQNVLGMGATGDMGLCVQREEQLQCFPQRLNPKVFSIPLVNIAGEPLPATRALRGETGVIITRDYRAQNVVAAFGPVGDWGLGMVVKIDAAEIFQPIRERLQIVIGLLLLLVAGGTLLLRSQIRPLATKLVDAESQARSRTAEVEAANRELEAFSYSVSHDLRAPLRHIAGFAEMLAGECSSALSAAGLRYLGVISDSVKQMGRLIDDLLLFSQMGRVEMRQTRVSMAELVKQVLQELAGDANGRNIQWDVQSLPDVRGDFSMLKQVWANLLSNAIKYTRPRDLAKIEIGSRRERGELEFHVRDLLFHAPRLRKEIVHDGPETDSSRRGQSEGRRIGPRRLEEEQSRKPGRRSPRRRRGAGLPLPAGKLPGPGGRASDRDISRFEDAQNGRAGSAEADKG
jgi:signal transduction histidine kinase